MAHRINTRLFSWQWRSLTSKVLFLWVFIAVLFGLTGCLWGNGEPYDQVDRTPDTPSNIPKGIYYWESSNYVCTPENGGDPIPSYKNAIYHDGSGNFYLLGDRCTDKWEPINLDHLELSSSYQFIGFEQGVFEFHSEEIPTEYEVTPSYLETWCRARKDSDPPNEDWSPGEEDVSGIIVSSEIRLSRKFSDHEIEVSDSQLEIKIEANTGSDMRTAIVTHWEDGPMQTMNISVTPTYRDWDAVYEADQFLLNIVFDKKAGDAYHPGTVVLNTENKTIKQEVVCRVTARHAPGDPGQIIDIIDVTPGE